MKTRANVKANGDISEERIWIEIPNKEDQDTYNKDTNGDQIKVIVLNDAICCEPIKTYGMETTAVTRGKMNPLIELYP